jgi:hypothetical protein
VILLAAPLPPIVLQLLDFFVLCGSCDAHCELHTGLNRHPRSELRFLQPALINLRFLISRDNVKYGCDSAPFCVIRKLRALVQPFMVHVKTE